MKISPTLVAAVVSATVGLGAAPAIAAQVQAEARTTLTGIGFAIYDADLADGLAPKVSFIDDVNRWRTFTQASQGNVA